LITFLEPAQVVRSCLAAGRPDVALKELEDICTPISEGETILRLACRVHIQLSAWSAAASAACLAMAPKEAMRSAAAQV
jgi:hypothetical protein